MPARDAMWILLFLDSDGCTYSCETLIGIFWSESDAETRLLELVAEGERYAAWEDARRTMPWQDRLRSKYDDKDELAAWRPSKKIEDYEIRRAEIGETLL